MCKIGRRNAAVLPEPYKKKKRIQSNKNHFIVFNIVPV